MDLTYIIIITYNAMSWIDQCLQSTADYPVVVVDNASTDQTIDHIQSNYPKVILLPQNKNLGFGQGNNIGISYALKHGAEHVFLLNQDAYLVDDALGQLIHFQKDNPEYGILSAIHTNAEVTKLDRNFSNYVRFDINPAFHSDHLLGRTLQDVYEVPFVNAAGWLLSEKCLMTVGGFDPIFFHYGEDRNYAQRVLYHKLKIGIIPNTYMVHDREFRKPNEPKKYSTVYFENLAKDLKVKYANINLNNISELKRKIVKLKKLEIKALLKFQNKKRSGVNKLIKVYLNVYDESLRSKRINILKKPNYLEL